MTPEELLRSIKTSEGCSNWSHGTSHGYGEVILDGKSMTAHRAVWLLTKGPIPEGMLVCHRCNNKLCINPDHLYLGTIAQNTIDAGKDGLLKRNSGSFKGKYYEGEVWLMRKLKVAGITYAKIGKMFKTNRSTIWCILNNKGYLPKENPC